MKLIDMGCWVASNKQFRLRGRHKMMDMNWRDICTYFAGAGFYFVPKSYNGTYEYVEKFGEWGSE
jgi:hypothetical protein